MTSKVSFWFLFLALALDPIAAQPQTTQIETEYLMTSYAPLAPPQKIDDSLLIFNVREGGWVKGPRVNGTVLAPTADWLHCLQRRRFAYGGECQTDG